MPTTAPRPRNRTSPAVGQARTDVVEARRVAAWFAAGCVFAGTAAVTLAVVAGPGPGLVGYVSEAGIAGSAYASTYQAGVFSLAAGLLLLAVALPTMLRLAARLLAAGGLATLLSGAVRCSDGCPLPPFERASTADLIHGGASIVAVAAVVFAMLAIVFSPDTGPRLRRVATVGASGALPLAAAVGLAMLAVGRGPLVGILERLLLAVTIAWGFATALLVAAGPRRHRSRAPTVRRGPLLGRRR